MKIAIVVLIILMAFVGFILYGVITEEIEEAQIGQLIKLSEDDFEVLDVDNLLQLADYAHRVSTYVNPSTDLVQAITTINVNLDYLSFFYYQNGDLVHEEYSLQNDKEFDFGNIKEECVIILPQDGDIKTNIKSNDITMYDLNQQSQLLYIAPSQTGLYQLASGEYTLKFELLKSKE